MQFALVWYLTRETGSVTVLATASLFALLPQIVLGPFAGAFVDRNNRRVVMIVSDSITTAATLLLAGLFALGWVQPWHVFVLMSIRSACGAFQWTDMSASTTLMVPKEPLTRVGGLNQMLQGLMGLVSPPVGALLISVLPTQGLLMIDVGTALLAVLPLLITRHFGLGALELGFTDTAWGAGIVAGGLLLGVWGGFKRCIFTSPPEGITEKAGFISAD